MKTFSLCLLLASAALSQTVLGPRVVGPVGNSIRLGNKRLCSSATPKVNCVPDADSAGSVTIGAPVPAVGPPAGSINAKGLYVDGVAVGTANMVYPGAGVPQSGGSAWGSSLALDTDGTLAANSDTKLASQKAVKTYVDTTVNYPLRAQMFHETSTAIVGNGVGLTQDSAVWYGQYACQVEPSANGDTFTNSFMLAAGTYTLLNFGYQDNYRGKIDWYIDNVLKVAGEDWYGGVLKDATRTHASIVVTGSGRHVLKAVVNGKNASATGYAICLTKMSLVPASDTVDVASAIQQVQDDLIRANAATFSSDGSTYWMASRVLYPNSFVEDTWYAMHGSPASFSSAQVKNIIDKFIAAKSGATFPIALKADATALAFYSGCDTAHNRATGDGAWALPLLERLYYDKVGTTTQFAGDAATLKAGLLDIPRNGSTHLVTAATPWVPFAFQDGVQFTGDNLMGSLLYWEAATRMSELYTLAGDGANATTFTADAALIAANLDTLWSAGDGMFLASTGQNAQIDIMGSAYAVYLGRASPSQQAAISGYLVANYGTLTSKGFFGRAPRIGRLRGAETNVAAELGTMTTAIGASA